MNAQQLIDIVSKPRTDAFIPVEERPDPRFGRFLRDGTPRLSPSQVNLLLTCPGRWKRSYLDGHPDPAGVDAMIGSLLHAAMEVGLQELVAGTLVGTSEIQTAVEEALQHLLNDPIVTAGFRGPAGDVHMHCEEAKFAIRTAWNWVAESGFQPTHIEHYLEHRFKAGNQEIGMVMIADAVGTFPDGRWAVIDWKFPKRNPKAYGAKVYARPGYVLAANLYDAALRDAGINVDDCIIAHFGRGERRPAIATHQATQQHREQAIHVARGAVELVLNQTLPDNPVAAGALCSPKYCAHWTICPGGGANL